MGRLEAKALARTVRVSTVVGKEVHEVHDVPEGAGCLGWMPGLISRSKRKVSPGAGAS